MSKSNISKKIKEYRKRLKISQAELARKANITRAGIANFEHGKVNPSLASLRKLSAAFNVTIDELIGHKLINKSYIQDFYDKFWVLEKLEEIDQALINQIAYRLLIARKLRNKKEEP